MCEDRARIAHLAHGARDQGRPLNTYSPDISASNLSLYLKMLFSDGFILKLFRILPSGLTLSTGYSL